MVGDNGKPVLPDQILQTGHLERFTAEVDLPVIDSTPIEILTQGLAVWATIGGEHQYRIERGHSMPSFES